jgi:hypothetical protein
MLGFGGKMLKADELTSKSPWQSIKNKKFFSGRPFHTR